MRVLIINDKLVSGGSELQSRREKELLEKNGHEVALLTFDSQKNREYNDSGYTEENQFYRININESFTCRIFNKMFLNKLLYKKIRSFIDSFRPDVIHVNNIHKAPITQYLSLKGYKVVQTIRDYYIVCPVDTCVKANYKSICMGYKYESCLKFKCCSLPELFYKLLQRKRLEKIRKSVVTQFIAPSKMLTEYSNKYGYNTICVNNPFDFEKVQYVKRNPKSNTKTFLYIGMINENKGVYELIEAFNTFSEGKKGVELVIIGKPQTAKDDIKFKSMISDKTNILYKGYLKYEDVIKEIVKSDCIVVPSIWMENYPNTVLEGLALGTLVIGSRRGGIPELLDNNNSLLFDICNKCDIIDRLEYANKISDEEYELITTESRERIMKNNNVSLWYEKIIKIFEN